MKLNILISSSVVLEEKDAVKESLKQLLVRYEIQHEIYDCNEHSTSWDFIPKQQLINDIIVNEVDWFICLIPHHQVGEKTWEELETILKEKKEGSTAVVSVFHPVNQPAEEKNTPIRKGMKSFDQIKADSERLLGCDGELYWVNYQYGDIKNLQRQLEAEFEKAYFNDKLFRTQHLIGLSRLGRDVEPEDIYFDRDRASVNNGFRRDKYYPRENVDGTLQYSLQRDCQITILLGPPGSGKTRAMYQLMADPSQLVRTDTPIYGLGMLADKQIVVLDRSNIHDVYDFLKEEQNYIAQHQPLGTYHIVCDQLKDVLTTLDRERMYEFVDMIVRYRHVRLIATSIPSAYANLCEMCKDHGYRHFEDEDITNTIEIPLISKDPNVENLRNWIRRELHETNDGGETIGDFIPGLNNYRQFIVGKLYQEAAGNAFLPYFLRAIQTTETYRYFTALFLPVVISIKCSTDFDYLVTDELRQKVVDTLNFLIRNNVIWVKAPDGSIVGSMGLRDLKLDKRRDSKTKFMFDGELFGDTPISTAFSYGLNEIVWDELEKEERDRRLRGGNATTLLYDMNSSEDIVDSAKDFYLSFETMASLRRLLSRIPRTAGYDDARSELWEYVYDECSEQKVSPENQEEFCIGLGHLISRAKDMDDVNATIRLFEKKGIHPTHDTIGELYAVVLRRGAKHMDDICSIIDRLRQKYQLQHHSFYSLVEEIRVRHLPFEEMLDRIRSTKYVVSTDNGEVMSSFEELCNLPIGKLHLYSMKVLLRELVNKAETEEHWDAVMETLSVAGQCLTSTMLYHYFHTFADRHRQTDLDRHKESATLLVDRLHNLLENYRSIVDPDNREAPYYCALSAAWNFRQTIPVYELYVKTFGRDNPRMILRMLNPLRDEEFQLACKYLYEIDARFKDEGSALSVICFNALIKKAPNASEALSVLPHLRAFQEQTLANILSVMKNKRKDDSKRFFYAYSLVMQPQFREHRSSLYIIGLLYDMATTRKHERFIREEFLKDLDDHRKSELIDTSSSITSIRLDKNYIDLDQTWEIFNTCRNYYRYENLYIKSDIYGQLLRKIAYLCQNDRELLHREMDKARRIIDADFPRIIRDQMFYSALYRHLPEKKIFNDDNSVSDGFIADMETSCVTDVRVWDGILLWMLKEQMCFARFRSFYAFMIDFYVQHRRTRTLMPTVLTAAYMMDAASTLEEYDYVETIAQQWIPDRKDRGKYLSAQLHAKRRLGIRYEKPKSRKETGRYVTQHGDRDYRAETDEVIDYAIRDINRYGVLSCSLLNHHLDVVYDIVKDIKKDENMRKEIVNKCVTATYWNVKKNLLEKHADDISYNTLSYIYLINISPDSIETGHWVKELLKQKEEEYMYDRVLCANLAQSVAIAQYDISLSMDFFEYWEDIMHDVGYDPRDPTSIPPAPKDDNDSEYKSYEGRPDYNGFWVTHAAHVRREMAYYVRELTHPAGSVVDKVSLRFIQEEMQLFREFDIPFPEYKLGDKVFDFEKEFQKLS